MSETDHDFDRAGIALPEALARLPLPPAPNAWPQLRQRLAARRRHRRWSWAAAASVLLALAAGLLLSSRSPDGGPAPSVLAHVTAPAPDLAPLQTESARLETLIAWAGEPWVENGDAAALDQHLTERLQQVDLELAAVDDPDTEFLLWNQRVELLRQRAQLAGAQLLLADSERSASDTLLAL